MELYCKFLSLVCLVLCLFTETSQAVLKPNYYKRSCPSVESIVRGVVNKKLNQTFVTIPGTLRLFFHDCFVEGCDASVMIASTPNNKAEKDFDDNLSLAGDGFDTVIKAKQAVEKVCPNTVSCADILAIATRDVITLAGGPFYRVELGRRDGRVSMASRCVGNLPKPTFDLNQLLANFAKMGLNLTDLVALSGAHTLGFSHCDQFASRIHGKRPDKMLNQAYAGKLRAMCPRNVDPTLAVDMDFTSPLKFDNAYYKILQQGKGLFTSDQILFNDRRSRRWVNVFASNLAAFNAAFVEAMTKMGRIRVKTTTRAGDIRHDCGIFN